MKNYEGKSAMIKLGEDGRVIDRSNFSNRELYPGNTWKKAHYIIFGYYPKDWDDMASITNTDIIAEMLEQERTYNCENPEFLENIDLYDKVFESIKLITGKEIVLDGAIHYKLMDKDSRFGYVGFPSYINKSLYILENASEENEFKRGISFMNNSRNYHLKLYTDIDNDEWLAINTMVYYIYQDNKDQKNPVEEAAKEKAKDKAKEELKEGKFTKYLNIKTKLYSDEVIKNITESFNKAVIPTFKDASKQSKEFFKVVEKAVKSGNFRLSSLDEDISKFTLENDDIIFIFCKNSVGMRLK